MNETLLSILMVVGVIGIAATLWLAAKSRNAKPAEPAVQAQPGAPQINQQLVQRVSGPSVPAPPIPASQPAAQPARALTVPANGAVTPMLVLQNENSAPDVLMLLRRAHEQLSTRQHGIESELARIEQLRGEREAVALQAAALDQAMRAFAVMPSVSHPIQPKMFEPSGTRSFEKLSTEKLSI